VNQLAPGTTEDCTGTYTATQADIDHGSVADSAIAYGTAPGASTASALSLPTTPATALQLKKTATASPTAHQNDLHVNDVVTYSFSIQNTGNTTIRSIALTDPLDSSAPVSCPVASGGLLPGDTMSCSGTTSHTVTQADVDSNSRSDTAAVTGTDAGNRTTQSRSSAVTHSVSAPAVLLTKSASVPPPGVVTNVGVGDVVTYSFVVKNTGNTTVQTVGVLDSQDSGSPVSCPVAASGLAPGVSVRCSGTTSHTVTQADVDSGSRTDTATASGTDTGGHVSAVSSSSATVNSTPAPAITLLKTADISAATQVGQVVNYSFLITNTGNVALTNVAVVEGSFTGSNPIGTVACPVTVLAPRAATVCLAHYTVTKTDAVTGVVTNTATVSAQSPTGLTLMSDPSTARIAVTVPALLLAMTGGLVSPIILAGGLIAVLIGLAMILLARRRRSISH